MELFSEIYSCYYNVVTKILKKAVAKPASSKDISEIIDTNAFSESTFHILPKLINGEWKLIDSREDGYISRINDINKRPITFLEKAWIKSILSDRRIALFFSNEQIEKLKSNLEDIEPLFDTNSFHYYDKFLDGDDYENEQYICNFRVLLAAIKKKRIVKISYDSGKGNLIIGYYLPCKIEYSAKDDKFRVFAVLIKHGKIIKSSIINIARIRLVEESEDKFDGEINFDEYIERNKCDNPVVLQISNERNALERCMLHFASYEKRTEYEEDEDKYISYIYYDKQDETELLIRILSFGPVVKVLGPDNFLKQLKDRVKKQAELLGT